MDEDVLVVEEQHLGDLAGGWVGKVWRAGRASSMAVLTTSGSLSQEAR
ncbi:hypothetical protein IMZ48_00635 [Candidatus Bathyarchaeota archaeon]|nr:hypothetical protein [Candidatus Bathyarchaeota archaeon]